MKKKHHSIAKCPNCREMISATGRRINGFSLEEVKCRKCGWGLVLRTLIPSWKPKAPGTKLLFLRCPDHKDTAVSDGRGNWVCPTCSAILKPAKRS